MVTELGRISRISTRRAYVVADIEGHEMVHETRDAGFYDPAPAVGDMLVRLADGTLSHRPQKDSCQVGGSMPLDQRSDDEIAKAKAKSVMGHPAKYDAKPASPDKLSVGEAIKRLGW